MKKSLGFLLLSSLSTLALAQVTAPPVTVPAAAAAAASAASAARARLRAATCSTCGTVQEVKEEKREGKGGMAGMIGGAVVGGLLGNQVGGGTGKTVATVGGAAAGGYVGNEVQKKLSAKKVWVTSLKMPDGSVRKFEQEPKPTWTAGAVLRVNEQNQLVAP